MKTLIPVSLMFCLLAGCGTAGAFNQGTVPVTVAKADVAWIQIEDREPVGEEKYPPPADKSFWSAISTSLAAIPEGLGRLLGLKALTDTAEEFARYTANVKLNTKYTRMSVGVNEDVERIVLRNIQLGRFIAEEVLIVRVKGKTSSAGVTEISEVREE